MSAPPVTFPDALIVAVGILRDGLPDSVKVGTIPPEKRPADKQGLPYIRVTVDSPADVRYPVARTDFLRVVVWNTSAANSLALAQTCLAVLMAFPGSSICRGFANPIGPTPASDPDAGPLVNRASDAGSPFAFLTVAVRLRPISL
ncbi:hypothetical protein OG474_09640 [Kribbella sp. NBC_01505]|uniref:hypothetical protein n=1 Tax=Kribbella sp. NBC_01505 TaxID=2903580 RepID=UPI00386A59FF